jgi:hypothetical protein
MTIREEFKKFGDDVVGTFLRFEMVENRRTNRPDLHAFLLLDQLCPSEDRANGYGYDIIGGAEHDEFWLDIDVDELDKVITPEQCLELHRCGVMYDESEDCFKMFA